MPKDFYQDCLPRTRPRPPERTTSTMGDWHYVGPGSAEWGEAMRAGIGGIIDRHFGPGRLTPDVIFPPGMFRKVCEECHCDPCQCAVMKQRIAEAERGIVDAEFVEKEEPCPIQ